MAARATTRLNLTDRAKRYRAQNAVKGPRKCVLCGSTSDLGVMHLDGNESHGEPANLAWGCRSCNQILAAAFKKIGAGRPTNQYNPAKGIPTFQQYSWAVSNHTRGSHDEAGAIIHATPKHKRIEYAKRIALTKRERGTDSSLPEWARNPGKFDRCVKKVKAKGGAKNAYAVCRAAIKRINPADAAAEAFEEFHGFPPEEVVTVRKHIFYHKHLAGAGELPFLKVWGKVDQKGHKIDGFDGAMLCFNEKMNQLFIEGGDQSLDLSDFGIDKPHELETIGEVTDIGYETNKVHLGDEGGEALYVHKFRSTNKNGKHVIVRIARYPDLIYDVRNEQLLFSGGSYEILREGIDK